MLTEDRFGAGKVRSLDPELGRKPRNVAEAGVQIVAEHLTANALLLERLLPDMGHSGVRGGSETNNVVLIFRRHGCHGIPL